MRYTQLEEGRNSKCIVVDVQPAYTGLMDGDELPWIDDNISIEWTSVAQLKRFNRAYLMGGGRNECLKEVSLLMNAFNIKYKLIEQFIYG